MRKRHAPLTADGPLAALARVWWAAHHPGSRITSITVAGTGHLRINWEDDDPDFGTFRLDLWRLYAETPHRFGYPVTSAPASAGQSAILNVQVHDEQNLLQSPRGEA